MSSTERDARTDWEERIGRHTDVSTYRPPALDAPTGVRTSSGRGQVTVDWRPVEGAVGYLVQRSDNPDGPFEPVEVGEPLVRAVPHPPFTDTTGTPGRPVWYRVSAVGAVDDRSQRASEPVPATPSVGRGGHDDGHSDGHCAVTVDASAPLGLVHRPWRPMIGTEHLSQLRYGAGPGGRHIGTEFAEALRMAHAQLGVRAVRAHAILHDELGVYREVDGQPVHDFGGIDEIYDQLLDMGLRPIVEIGFMPRDLARDPSRTVFEYDAIISPPRDWDRWAVLVADLTSHLVSRYGREEVRTWGFEVWNEANLEVFWSGTPEEYLRLYDVTARAVKSVDRALPVGGPASAAAGWLDLLLGHAQKSGSPVDFLSTHTYGNAPLDLRPMVARHGLPGLPLWWTEWGAHASHFNRAHDSVWSAAYLVRGMVSAMGRLEALAYWTVSDHFEELGRPRSLLHGGFGLLSVGNLRKPRWWGLWMLEQLRAELLPVTVTGDGAGDLVGAIGSVGPDRDIALVVWNGTADVTKSGGEPLLDRDVDLTVTGLPDGRYELRHRRLDEHHSNLNRAWDRLSGGRDWPDEAGWTELRRSDRLFDLEPPAEIEVSDGSVTVSFPLPMPAVSLIELIPVS
jgi:xylan 1,4-beta-xylosidase